MTTDMLKCFMVKNYLNFLFIVTKPDIVISRLLCAESKEYIEHRIVRICGKLQNL